MSNLQEVIMHTDVAIDNSLIFAIVCIPFFILALVVLRTKEKPRRLIGGVMLAASVPGLLAVVTDIALFLIATVYGMIILESKTCNIVTDNETFKYLADLCNTWPLTFVLYSVFYFPVIAVITLVCGIVLLRTSKRRIIGGLTCVAAVVLFASAIYMTITFFAYAAS